MTTVDGVPFVTQARPRGCGGRWFKMFEDNCGVLAGATMVHRCLWSGTFCGREIPNAHAVRPLGAGSTSTEVNEPTQYETARFCSHLCDRVVRPAIFNNISLSHTHTHTTHTPYTHIYTSTLAHTPHTRTHTIHTHIHKHTCTRTHTHAHTHTNLYRHYYTTTQ